MQKEIFFISSRWRNRDKVQELTERMRALGFEVLSFLEYHLNKEDVDADPEEVMCKFEGRSQNDDVVE